MGDLPRWVNRSDVDSATMLSVFLKYDVDMRQLLDDEHLSFQPSWHGHLCAVIHRDPAWIPGGSSPLPMPLEIPQVPCRLPGCHRCGVRGGMCLGGSPPIGRRPTTSWPARALGELRSPSFQSSGWFPSSTGSSSCGAGIRLFDDGRDRLGRALSREPRRKGVVMHRRAQGKKAGLLPCAECF